jgi:anti-sigma regulatory factor (Ser/Thr protein kinase)
MEVIDTAVVSVGDPSSVGEARRVAGRLAARAGFDETGIGQVSLVVTEVATNLAKHAGGGTVLLSAIAWDSLRGIDVIALDQGPGIADIGQALRDGHSTAGSAGTGLGAIGRLSGEFDLYSVRESGTAVLARMWAPRTTSRKTGRVSVAGLSAARPGEAVCGDAWAVEVGARRIVVLVADGLGHGPDAAHAAQEAVRIFRARHAAAPAEVMQAINAALRSTRGAAAAVAALDLDARVVHYAGVGNISASIWSDGSSRSLVSHNGTLGHGASRVQEFSYPWPQDSLLVVHSDGLGTHWTLDRYPGLASHHPALVAGVLYRDHQRGRDDVTVVALRETTAAEKPAAAPGKPG